MPRTCTVCAHRERAAINQALVDRFGSLRQVAKDYGVTESSLHRHNRDHLPAVLRAGASAARENEAVQLEAVAVERAAEPVDLLSRVRRLYDQANEILGEARAGADGRLACIALDRLAKLLAVEGAALQSLAERGAGEQRVIIQWRGAVCEQCGHDPLAPKARPLALVEPAEGLESPLAHSASKLNGQG